MDIITDVLLRGPVWGRVIEELGSIFKTRTNYSIYMLCVAIGVMYDKRIDKVADEGTSPRTVPRTVLITQNHENGQIDLFFQAAMISSQTMELSEEERLGIAFGDIKYNKMDLLTQFANFGVTKLEPLIGTSTIETMMNIKNFLDSSLNGTNFELEELSDDLLIDNE